MTVENSLQEKIYTSLNLSETDRKYICVEAGTVYFTIPLKIDLGLWFVDKKISLDGRSLNRLYADIKDSLVLNLFSDNGFWNLTHFTLSTNPHPQPASEFTVFKEAHNEEEIKEAVLWLVQFKNRFGIA
jgi:hypothetical protein